MDHKSVFENDFHQEFLAWGPSNDNFRFCQAYKFNKMRNFPSKKCAKFC